MKVNMTPNPLDVVTIHASQGDTEARQWEFELHNNGELIDTSEITEQLFFKAYKGGTEQLLPENTSTPTTSPFLGDIRYPQGLLTDQEFTYRESPTESDGLAKITDIKGNTLVWNQLAKELNATNWPTESATVSYSDGICTLTPTGFNGRISADVDIIVNHKYLMLGDFTNVDNQPVYFYIGAIGSYSAGIRIPQTSVLTRQSKIYTATETGKIYVRNNSNTGVVTIKNLMLIDLTQMGLDISSPSEFTSLFPLSYYSYNQGSLLSFNGNGIKTVSKNQFNTQIVSPSTTVGTTLTKGDGSIRLQYTGTGRYTGFNFMNPNGGLVSDWANKLLLKKKYRLSFDFSGAEVTWTCGLRTASANSFVGSITMQNQGHYSLTLNLDTVTEDVYISWARTGNSTNPFDVTVSNIQLELGTTETPYTPYEEQTISLPISTYFPTGMKSAGTVYDELTPTKGVTRIGAADLGTLTWVYQSNYQRFRASFIGAKQPSSSNLLGNIVCPLYVNVSMNEHTTIADMTMALGAVGYDYLYVRNLAYTDATAFKTAMSGVYLYYELATPTETSFTTASLVTENAEIPLSNEDGTLIGKCTEQLSDNPGFIDAKIKLADGYGECYSNKLQLHIERKPS